MMSVPTLATNSTAEERAAFVAKLLSDSAEVLAKNPGNRCCKYLADYLESDEGKDLSNDGKRYPTYQGLYLLRLHLQFLARASPNLYYSNVTYIL